MKILFVFTGGTIGTTESGGVRSADHSKPYKIISAYKARYGIDFEYNTKEPYNELSENNTGLNISALISCVAESLSGGYDGIVVTHGTDTLQYSAAALGYCLGSQTPPICLVSSNAPIEDESSNGIANLRGAIRFIEEKAGSGVFSVYSNKAGEVSVHRGTRLIGPMAYSDASHSIFGQIYASFDESFTYHKNEKYSERSDEISPFGCVSLLEANEKALVISPYLGMVYPELKSGIKYVILNTYHSGTVNTKSKAAREFFLSAKERGITVFATGIEDGICYESMSIFEELGITAVKNLSPIAAYMKLWMADSAGIDPKSVIDRSLSGDIA